MLRYMQLVGYPARAFSSNLGVYKAKHFLVLSETNDGGVWPTDNPALTSRAKGLCLSAMHTPVHAYVLSRKYVNI